MARERQIIDADVQIVGNLEVLDGIANGALSDDKTKIEKSQVDIQFVQGDVSGILADLAELESDSSITPVEKLIAKQIWENVVAEGNPTTGTIPAQATEFGVDDSDFDTAYAALNTYLNTTLAVFADMTSTTTIVRATWNTKWNDYFAARTNLLNEISDASKARLDDIADDEKITPVEKLLVKQIWDNIVTEGNPSTGTIPAQATEFGVDDSAFDTAYATLNTYLNTTLAVFADMTATTTIVRGTWDTNWNNYFKERTDLLNDISNASKNRLDDLDNDSKLTPTEKLVVQREWDNVEAEYPKVVAFAAVYGFEAGNGFFDAYDTAYDDLDYYLNTDPGPLQDLETTTDIIGGTLRSTFAAYFEAREDLFSAIATGEVMRAPSDDNLLVHISFDDDTGGDGDEIMDSSGNANTGTISGAPTWAAGRNGTCLTFDGVDDWVEMDELSDDNDFTVSVWFKCSGSQNDTFATIAAQASWSGTAVQGWRLSLLNNDLMLYTGDGSTYGYRSLSEGVSVADDTWHHVVFHIDNTNNKLNAWFDSVQTRSEYSISFAHSAAPDSDAGIGRSPTLNAADCYFKGSIDEFRVYSCELTQENVNFLYKIPGGPVQSVVTTSRIANLAITAEKIALTSIDSTHMASGNVEDYFEDVGVAPSNEYLAAYYPLNKSCEDYSGHGHHGTLTGAASYAAGVVGNGFDFAGSASQYISTDLNMNGWTEFTISGWMKADTWLPAAQRIAMSNYKYNSGGTTTTGFFLGQTWVNADDISVVVYKSGVAGASAYTSGDAFTSSVLRHVVAVFKGGEYLRLYVNGVLVSEDTSSVPTDITAEYNVFLGRRSDSTSYPWDGLIEEVRIYNKAYGQAEVSYLYRNPAGANQTALPSVDPGTVNLVGYWSLNDSPDDFSGNGRHGTLTAGAGGYENGIAARCYHLDGASERIALPALTTALTAFTVAGWIKADTLSPADANNRIVDLLEAGGDGIFLYLDSAGDDRLQFDFKDGGVSHLCESNYAIAAATWYFVVATYNGATAKLYVNAVLQADTEAYASGSVTPTLNMIGALGSDGTANNWDGLLAHVRLFNKALSQAEIDFLYYYPAGIQPAPAVPKDPGRANLQLYLSLDELEGVAVVDSSGQGHHSTLTAGAGAWEPGVVGNCYHFDGLASKIAITGLSTSGSAWSISCWINIDEMPTSGNTDSIFDHETTRALLALYNDAGTVRIAYYNNSAWDLFTSFSPATGTLYHIALVVNGTVATLFVNGINQGSATVNSVTLSSSGASAIGSRYDLGSLFFDGIIDEFRLYDKALSPAEALYLYRHPGGAAKGLATRHDIGVAELTSRHMAFGGDLAILDNDEEWNPSSGELFPLDRTLISDQGRVPIDDIIVLEPAYLADSEENQYENPRAKSWSGLTGSPRTDTIGVWKATENLVPYPEDFTEWDATQCAGSVLEETFEGVPWQRALISGTSEAYIEDLFGFDGDPAPVRVIVRKGATQTGNTEIYLRDETIAAGGVGYVKAAINWSAGTVTVTASGTGITATEVDKDWIVANEMVSISFIAAGLSTGAADTKLRFYPDLTEAAGRYADFVMIKVEDSDYPTPYTPTSRPAGVIEYRKQLKDEGTIECWCRPRHLRTNVSEYEILWMWYKDDTHYFMCYHINGGFYVRFQWGGTARYLQYSSAFANNAAYWTDVWVKVDWDFSAGTGRLQIQGSTVDTAWDAAPDAYDETGWRFFLGSYPEEEDLPLAVGKWNGEITDFSVNITRDGTQTHYQSGKPWKPAYTLENYYQSLSLSRKVNKFTRSEIGVVDKHHRLTRIGSRGLEVLDRQGNVIHDTVSAPLVTEMSYAGHLFLNYDLSSKYILLSTPSPVGTTWTDLQCVVQDNINIHAVILFVRVQLHTNIAWDDFGYSVHFRAKGTTSTYYENPSMYARQIFGDLYMTDLRENGMIICPVGEDNMIQYYYDRVPSPPNSEELMIVQLGMFA